MKINDLKVGDKVFIRSDIQHGIRYGRYIYTSSMGNGVKQVKSIYEANRSFRVFGTGEIYCYTPEMVDWGKTSNLNIPSCFKKITQFGENKNETTKAITHNGEEIIVKNNNEENDIEKAVMLLMLKQRGVTYGDIKREVEKVKVKWEPAEGEEYYWINSFLQVDWFIWERSNVDETMLTNNNCFKTKEEAERKAEKIKEVLRGE